MIRLFIPLAFDSFKKKCLKYKLIIILGVAFFCVLYGIQYISVNRDHKSTDIYEEMCKVQKLNLFDLLASVYYENELKNNREYLDFLKNEDLYKKIQTDLDYVPKFDISACIGTYTLVVEFGRNQEHEFQINHLCATVAGKKLGNIILSDNYDYLEKRELLKEYSNLIYYEKQSDDTIGLFSEETGWLFIIYKGDSVIP
jgi:hypothetical protein